MKNRTAVGGNSEAGSALVIALLVTVVLTLLGISFLLMTETENRIAVNEQRSTQAFFVAQSTARIVARWFDAPLGAVAVPAVADVDRTQRRILDETDPYDPADVTPANGVLGSAPYYKQGVDIDADGADDLFDRPYRLGLLHPFLGTEDGPDIVIDETDSSTNAEVFLRALEQTILPDFPGEGLLLRIARIDLFAPPYVRSGASWSRYGVATVRVVARILEASSGRVVAEREVRAVISEVPYWGAYGALHACGDLVLTGSPMTVHWGAVTAGQVMQLPSVLADIPRGLPRELPSAPRSDPLLSALDWDDWSAQVAGETVEDPWLRFIVGGTITAPAVPNSPQPYASPWNGWTTGNPAPGPCCDVYTHLFQDQALAGCPVYDYDDWKAIAGSSVRGAHYFSWNGSAFQEDGTGTSGTVQSLTQGREGIFFFDTNDGLRPQDSDGDGVFENLTPALTISGSWNFRGVLFLNATRFGFNGASGNDVDVQAPGEPFDDDNQDGVFDVGEKHVNTTYPTTAGTAFNALPILASGTRDARGPVIPIAVSFQGLLINQGAFEATGVGTLYGSVVAGSVTQSVADGSLPTPRLIFDATMVEGFPPTAWGLPRVTVTGWVTQRE